MSESILDSAKPLLVVSKFMGFVLYSIDPESFEVSFKKVDVVAIVAAFCLNMCLNWIYWHSYLVVHTHDSKVVQSGIPVLIYISFLLYKVTIIWNFFQRKKTAFVLKKLHDVDVSFRSLGIEFDYQKQKWFSIKLLIVCFCIGISLDVTESCYNHINNLKNEIGIVCFSIWGLVCVVLLSIQFIVATREIELPFKALNSYVR